MILILIFFENDLEKILAFFGQDHWSWFERPLFWMILIFKKSKSLIFSQPWSKHHHRGELKVKRGTERGYQASRPLVGRERPQKNNKNLGKWNLWKCISRRFSASWIEFWHFYSEIKLLDGSIRNHNIRHVATLKIRDPNSIWSYLNVDESSGARVFEIIFSWLSAFRCDDFR